ncbi:hypothetical protein [Kitasatospora purpeofusca]|uniref:hypothetical protein n=1 Tax=Kitasatospora purpeofusca TaxID=67352 RepID=UPI003F4A8B4A
MISHLDSVAGQCWSVTRLPVGVRPAEAFLDADAGAFAVLGFQDAGVTGVSVEPAQAET